ncbi:MAG: nucleotidyltransferase domain-containing protein [Candidatus Woesearchaeota archaeon]
MITKDKITEEKIEEVVSKIVEASDPEKVILFGSYANKNHNEDSDLDFLVIKETNLPQRKRGIEVRKNLWGIGVPVDIVVYTPEEIKEWQNISNSFIHNILKKEEVLYAKKEKLVKG